MKSRSGRWAWVGAIAFLVVASFAVSSTAVAQQGADEIGVGGIDAQTFRPAVGPGSIVMTEGADTSPDRQPHAGLFVDFLSDPLVLRHDDDSLQPVVNHQLNAQLIVGMGLFDRFHFELGIPFVAINDGEYMGQAFDTGGAGDLFARAKATIFSSADDPVGLGVMLDLTAPTGDSDLYRGSPQPTATPSVVADTRFETPAGEVLMATNLGMRLQGTQTVHNLEVGPQFIYGAGIGVEVVPHILQLGIDARGAATLNDPARQKSPLELLGKAEVRVSQAILVNAGGGGGVVGGVGSPKWRAFAGVSYRPLDLSGMMPEIEPTEEVTEVEEPTCPPEPDGFAGPYDEEGCAITPETFAGCDDLDPDWEGAVDEWGCPLLDSDGDGFLVWEDSCPFEPIVFIGVENDDGCPNYDVAGDGVPNIQDHCPLEPGLRTNDGCPPEEDEELAARVDDEIEIEKRVHFESNKAIIKEESYPLLDEVALLLRNESDIRFVEIAGHTDARGEADYNMMLSEERARAVREFLIERGGIRAARLAAEGYGSSEPIIDEDTDEAHAENRRVEFHIVDDEE